MFPVQLVLHAASLVKAEPHVLRIDEQIEVSEKVLAENAADLGIHPLDCTKIQDGDAVTEYDALDGVVADETQQRLRDAVGRLSPTPRIALVMGPEHAPEAVNRVMH